MAVGILEEKCENGELAEMNAYFAAAAMEDITNLHVFNMYLETSLENVILSTYAMSTAD